MSEEDRYSDEKLYYVLSTMEKRGNCGCRQIDLTPYLNYKIIINENSTLLIDEILSLGEFLDKISDSKVYEANK